MTPEESFIMFGYGSPTNEFCNQTKQPYEFSSEELKIECVQRAKMDPNIHPDFLALAEQCVIDTAYIHIIRNSEAVKPWQSDSVTLIGDAVFK